MKSLFLLSSFFFLLSSFLLSFFPSFLRSFFPSILLSFFPSFFFFLPSFFVFLSSFLFLLSFSFHLFAEGASFGGEKTKRRHYTNAIAIPRFHGLSEILFCPRLWSPNQTKRNFKGDVVKRPPTRRIPNFSQMSSKGVRANKYYFLCCIPRPPTAAQPNKEKPSACLPICLRPGGRGGRKKWNSTEPSPSFMAFWRSSWAPSSIYSILYA